MIVPKEAKTSEEQKRFAMSPGLRYEDLPASPRRPEGRRPSCPARRSAASRAHRRRHRADLRHRRDARLRAPHEPSDRLGRGLTEDDQRRRRTVAVVGATLASKLFGGADPVGRDVVRREACPFRIVGVQAPSQIFNDEIYMDANGILIPLETYMDRMDPDHKLTRWPSSCGTRTTSTRSRRLMLGRVRQAHHGIEDVEIKDLDSEAAQAYAELLRPDATAGASSSSASPAPCCWWAAWACSPSC